MDSRLSAVFRLLRVRSLDSGQVYRWEYAQSQQSQLQISSNYQLSTFNSDFNRIYSCFGDYSVNEFQNFKLNIISKLKFFFSVLRFIRKSTNKSQKEQGSNTFLDKNIYLLLQFVFSFGLIIVDSNLIDY